jgi:lipoprotein-anchoring transpeptidase ErfK/SrfK
MTFKNLTVALFVSSALFAGQAAASDLRLEVDVSDNELVAYVGDEAVARYDVSTGIDDSPTPHGTFKISKVIYNPAWRPPDAKWAKKKTPKEPGHPDNPMKKVKMYFREPDYYIHGTGDLDNLGRNASHGCVRMSPSDVTELAKVVMEHGGKPKPEPWYKRIFRLRRQTVVFLAEPIPIQIKG